MQPKTVAFIKHCKSSAYTRKAKLALLSVKWAGKDSNLRRLAPTGLQSVTQNSQDLENNILNTTQNKSLPTSLRKDNQNELRLPENLPDDLVEIVVVWPELPEQIKAARWAI